MTRTIAPIAALALLAVCSTAYALYSVAPTGTWPKSWPIELEPLRKQSRTLVGPTTAHRHFAVRFTDRDDFEPAWPHIIEVKRLRYFWCEVETSFLGIKLGIAAVALSFSTPTACEQIVGAQC